MTDPQALPDLLFTLRDTALRHNMFTPGVTVVIGVSGGADSTALLHALAELREEWRLNLVACHLNHGFRGEEAEGDAGYVRGLCDRLGVACRVESVDVPALARRRHLSAQQAARDVRHAFLRRVAADVNADRIALAHTRDDRAETVLLNILRGSGLDGAPGFAAVALPLVRPLYDTTRAQVEAYCARHELQPRMDSSNLKTAYRRNRVRLELLPLLRRDYNAHADDALLRLADLAGEDNALLDTLAADALDTISPRHTHSPPGRLTLPGAKLNALPLALRRRVARLAILRVRGHLRDVDFKAVQNLLAALETTQNYEAVLPASDGPSIIARCRNKTLEIFQAPIQASSLAWSVPLDVPGRTRIAQAGVTVSVALCRLPDLPGIVQQWRKANTRSRAKNEQGMVKNTISVVPDATLMAWTRADVTLPLLARAWQAGDRMRPRGLNGTKKVQDIFADAKTPRERRQITPVILDANGSGRILSVGGLRVDETALFSARLADVDDNMAAWLEQEDTQREQKDGANAPSDGTDAAQELLTLLLEYEI